MMDFKLSRGRIMGQPRLIKLCRPIFQIVGNKIYEKCRRSMPQREKKPLSDDMFKCGICFDFKPDSDMFKGFNCKHNFCTECISSWVTSEMKENIHKVITCPNPKCSVKLDPEYFQTILPEEVKVKWESARLESSIPSSQKIHCPYKNCSVLLVNDCGKKVVSSECPLCHRTFCAQCEVPWHARMKCREFQKLKRTESEKDMDTKFFHLAKTRRWKRCPKCQLYVERHSGCNYMRCRCGCKFCYKCGAIYWKFGHIWGNCSAQ